PAAASPPSGSGGRRSSCGSAMMSAPGSASCSPNSPSCTGSTAYSARALRVDLAAEVDERLNGLGHERARLLGVGEAVRPRLHAVLLRLDLDVDDTGVTEIACPHRHDGTSIPARAANEEFARLGLGCLLAAAPSHQRASATACATTSRSTKFLNSESMRYGRWTTRTAGVLKTPSLRRIAVPLR